MNRLLPFLSLLIVLLVSCTQTYIVTFQGGVGGSVSIPGGEYDEGTTVSVSAQPETGYEFQSWSDGSSQNPRTITVTESLNLTAFFNKQQFTVTVSAQGEGSVQSSGGDSQGNFEYGATARFEAIPASGWVFDSWSGDAIGTTNPLSITVDKTQTITAVFKRQKYDLTIIVVGEGTVEETVVVQPGQYDYETQVKLTATPDEGWSFTGWTGDIESTENPIEVSIEKGVDITALFELDTFSVSIKIIGPGKVNNSTEDFSIEGDPDKPLVFIAEPTNDWNMFLTWDGDINNTTGAIEIYPDSDLEIRAIFLSKEELSGVSVTGEGELMFSNFENLGEFG